MMAGVMKTVARRAKAMTGAAVGGAGSMWSSAMACTRVASYSTVGDEEL